MTNLTPEERATKKQIIENISETYIPISVIEQIKADIENISETESITDGITVYGVQYRTGASVKNEILELIDRHIKEYMEWPEKKQ